MDWVTFLRVMIEDEKAAMSKYKIALEQADSEELASVLEKLMNEEEFHIDFLEQDRHSFHIGFQTLRKHNLYDVTGADVFLALLNNRLKLILLHI